MLKLVKIGKEVNIYHKIPLNIFVLKWLDIRIITILRKMVSFSAWCLSKYQNGISFFINKKYNAVTVTAIKHKKSKKKVK